MRKAILSIILALGLAMPAMAIGRYDIRARHCADIQNILKRDRQAILRYPSRDGQMTLYGLYVSNTVQCTGMGEYGIRVSVPSADGPCTVISCRPLSDLKP